MADSKQAVAQGRGRDRRGGVFRRRQLRVQGEQEIPQNLFARGFHLVCGLRYCEQSVQPLRRNFAARCDRRCTSSQSTQSRALTISPDSHLIAPSHDTGAIASRTEINPPCRLCQAVSINCGSPTSPMSAYWRSLRTWRCCSMRAAGAWSDGPWRRICGLILPSRPCRAIVARRPAPGSLVHHSDRGVQYPTKGGAWMEPVIMMRR